MGEKKRISTKLKEQIWIKDEFTCQSCGATISWNDLRVGYILPDHEGGRCEPSNLQAICKDCHRLEVSKPEKGEVERRLLRMIWEMGILKDEVKEHKEEKGDLREELKLLERDFESLMKENMDLKDRVEHESRLVKAFKNKYERTLKDLDNYRRRTDNEVELKVRQGTKKMIMGIIGALDNIDRAIGDLRSNHGTETSIETGLLSIRKGIINVLSEHGVKEEYPEGERFDPRIHEAVDVVQDKSVPDGTVVAIDLSGFHMNDSVLRAARVTVSKGGKPDNNETKDIIDREKALTRKRPKKSTVIIEDDDEYLDWDHHEKSKSKMIEIEDGDEFQIEV